MWGRRWRGSGIGRGGVVVGDGRDMPVEEPVHQCRATVSYGFRGEETDWYWGGVEETHAAMR